MACPELNGVENEMKQGKKSDEWSIAVSGSQKKTSGVWIGRSQNGNGAVGGGHRNRR